MESKSNCAKKKRLLTVINGIRRGGIEIAAVTFQTHLDKEKYDCTYLIRRGDNKDAQMLEAIAESGADIVEMPEHVDNYIKEYFWLKKYFSQNGFDIVHSHLLFYNGIVMRAAAKRKIEKRIAHSHATKRNAHMSKLKGFLLGNYERFMRFTINRYATDIIACSRDAGVYLYGQKEFNRRGVVLNNCIETELYKFSAERQRKVRDRLGIDNEFVVGHVGSVYWIKNQEFLIKVFSQLLKQRENSLLLLVGEIRDDGIAQKLVQTLGIADKVRFLGSCDDIPDMLCAMDAFVFPSLFEALPIVPVEAQASQLPCVISDAVVAEIKTNENVEFMSLEKSAEEWAQKIIELSKIGRETVDLTALENIYSIKSTMHKLEKIYEG